MQYSRLGHHDDFLRGRLFAECDHLFGRTDFIGEHTHGLGALWVGDHRRIGILFADPANAARRELDVDVTSALP